MREVSERPPPPTSRYLATCLLNPPRQELQMAIILTTPINQLHPVQLFSREGASLPPLLVIDRAFPILKLFQNVPEHVLLKFRQAIDTDVYGFALLICRLFILNVT